MKKIIIVFTLITLVSCQRNPDPSGRIEESQMLDLNGTRQFVMIRGESISNPVLLHLHGGPGASEIGGMRKYNSDLERDFTVVYWDQRNAGKSYAENFPASEIKVSKYVEDVNKLARYLKNRLKVEKIMLVGHSWGSRLGTLAVQKYPEHFSALVTTGQEVAAAEGELRSYEYTLAKAKEFKVDSMVQQLQAIGPPQGGDFRTMYPFPEAFSLQKYLLLELNRRIYDGIAVEDIFANFMDSDEYTVQEKENYLAAADFTNLHIANDPDYNNFDFRKQFPTFKIPVFFFAGNYDYINPTPLAEEYFKMIQAPKKEFVLFEKSGHDPAWEQPAKYHAELLRVYNLVK